MNTDVISETAQALCLKRDVAELELAAAVLADPAAGIAALYRFCAGADVFERDDLRLIVLAAKARDVLRKWTGNHERDVFGTIVLAAKALKDNHYWDESQILGNYGSALWSSVTLARLFCSWPACDTTIRQIPRLAEAIINIHERQRGAANAFYQCVGLLRGNAELPGAEQSIGHRERVVVMPLRKGKRGAA